MKPLEISIEVKSRVDNAIKKKYLTLDLSGIGIEKVEFPNELEFLEELDLSENNLMTLPSSIFKLTNLLEIHLFSNPADLRTGEIEAFLRVNEARKENLNDLELSELGLSTMPKGIAQLSNLKRLDLYGNYISDLGEEIYLLKGLEQLDISGNRITKISDKISNLKNLTSLYAYGNLLTKIPKEIGQLKKLEALSLSSNKILSLPKELANINSLYSLLLNNNEISFIPSSFENFELLKEFDIRENNLNILEEVYERYPLEIIKYILAFQDAKKPLHEAKLIVYSASN
jgi:Leucine-rich repeat (LRR) protein